MRTSLQTLLGRYYTLAGMVLFLAGVLLRLLALGRSGFWWEVVRDLGTFVAVAVAIPFFYERLIKAQERHLFLHDLESVLDAKLPHFTPTLKLYETGRPSLSEKVALIAQARCSVTVVGTANRSFVGYSEQRPAHEFKDIISELLRRGVDVTCLLLDPASDVAGQYAHDRGEDDLVERIHASLRTLHTLAEEFERAGAVGKLNINLYQHYPSFSALCIDGDEGNGRMLVSHYLYGARRAEAPYFEFSRTEHPHMFGTYWTSISKLVTSTKHDDQYAHHTLGDVHE